MFNNDDHERFWARVAVAGDEDCWIWIGKKSGSGYGMFRCTSITPANQQAHRVSWMMAHGRWPDPRLVIMHIDDCNKACVNPRHLLEGTTKRNIRDALSVVTDDDVIEIRRLAKLGWTHPDIAKKYGVARSTIESIVNRRRHDGP